MDTSWNPDRFKNWTLFLDRDGVINRELPADYVKCIEEFEFEHDAIQSIADLSRIFGLIIIVTNQRGVGAGLMTQSDLDAVHEHMKHHIQSAGGRIDAIYAATAEDRQSIERKPNPTMGMMAKSDFPEIEFDKSLMVGNSESDIRFGQNLGMKTAFIDDKNQFSHSKSAFGSDWLFSSLATLTKGLLNSGIE
ncbi:MAG: D-glycero-alpha-D-manno-heptose-1,7-bisphosphate 7-phosphatase [Bacteroidota bacterium]